MKRFLIGLGIIAAASMVSSSASALDSIRVMAFPSLTNLPIFAAEAKGMFAKRNLSVELLPAPSSDVLRAGLLKNDFQIVHSAVDNAVATAELDKANVVVLMGGDNGWNNLFVQSDVQSIKDLRGKSVLVDAPDTAYAFQVYEVLKRAGLNKGDYDVKAVGATFRRFDVMKSDKSAAATALSPPYSILARRSGLRDMGNVVALIGPYQSNSAWVLKSWAEEHSDLVVRYIQAYIEGGRWASDPANKAEVIDLLMKNLKLPQDVATEAYAIATDPKDGMAKDAAIDLEGFKNVLKLRADWTGQTPGPPEKYIDLSYYKKALSGL